VCYWVKTIKGAAMLVDVVQKVGQLTFTIGADGIARRSPPGEPGHESHFVGCPQRDQWRKDRKPKAKPS